MVGTTTNQQGPHRNLQHWQSAEVRARKVVPRRPSFFQRDSPSPTALDEAVASASSDAFGSSNQKVFPVPGTDSTPTLPPIRSTAVFTMANPTPLPSILLLEASRSNISKILSQCSRTMPIPLSRT